MVVGRRQELHQVLSERSRQDERCADFQNQVNSFCLELVLLGQRPHGGRRLRSIHQRRRGRQ
jgi:hypothetical protein